MPFLTPAKAKPAPKSAIVNKAVDHPKVKGLATIAALKQLQAAIEGIIATTEGEVRSTVNAKFIENGIGKDGKPGSFYIQDSLALSNGKAFDATANCQLRRRASNRPLSSGESELLTENGVAVETRVSTPSQLVLNSKYAENQELLAKVDAKLASLGLPDDFIVQTEEVSGNYVTDESVVQVMKKNDKDLIETLLPLVTTLSVGRYSVSDSETAIEAVRQIVNGMVFKTEEEAPIEPKPTAKRARKGKEGVS